jgi:hypothetical protein
MKPKLSSARLWWKLYWRQLRIIRRETQKAYMDCLIYGTGFTHIGPDVPGGIRHIPVQELRVMKYG